MRYPASRIVGAGFKPARWSRFRAIASIDRRGRVTRPRRWPGFEIAVKTFWLMTDSGVVTVGAFRVARDR